MNIYQYLISFHFYYQKYILLLSFILWNSLKDKLSKSLTLINNNLTNLIKNEKLNNNNTKQVSWNENVEVQFISNNNDNNY
jgi:hypothetical protein